MQMEQLQKDMIAAMKGCYILTCIGSQKGSNR